jgi:hypothetical protein
MSNINNDTLLEALVEAYMERGYNRETAQRLAESKFDKDEPFPDEEHRDESMFAGPEIVEDE